MRGAVRNQRASTRRQRNDQHLLDVKVRSRTATKQRNRKLVAWFSSVLVFAGFVFGTGYGIHECLEKFFWQNPDYNLVAIDIKTDGPLTREQIAEATGLREGINVFSVNLAQTREALLALPQVERAEVERVLPNQIAIEISERKPVAWLAAKATEDPSIAPDSFLIDAKGVLIKMRSQLPDYLHLPVICGLPMDNFQAGATVESPELKAALDLLRLTAEKPEQFQPRTINLARGYCMVVTDQRKARITFAIEHVDLQLERLGVLLDQVEEGNHEIQTANLIVQRNTPVTFMPPPEETPAAAAAASPAPSAALKTPPLKKPEPFFKGPVRKATPVKSAASPKPVRKAVPVDAHTKTRSENG